MKKVFVSIFVLAAILTANNEVAAYDTTAQKATRLTDDYVLFSISYDFGFLNRATLIPFIGYENVAPGAPNIKSVVSYSIETESGKPVDVMSGGFVTQAVTNDKKGVYYYLPYGKKNEYTLNVIAKIPKGAAKHRLAITSLPYVLEDLDGNLDVSGADTTKLATYVTEFVE